MPIYEPLALSVAYIVHVSVVYLLLFKDKEECRWWVRNDLRMDPPHLSAGLYRPQNKMKTETLECYKILLMQNTLHVLENDIKREKREIAAMQLFF